MKFLRNSLPNLSYSSEKWPTGSTKPGYIFNIHNTISLQQLSSGGEIATPESHISIGLTYRKVRNNRKKLHSLLKVLYLK